MTCKCVLYQCVRNDDLKDQIETLADFLLRGSMVTSRSETVRVDKGNLRLANQCFVDIQDGTSIARKLMLLRSHMQIQALRVLVEMGVIYFAPKTHTSGTMQPLEFGMLWPWKAQIDTVLCSKCSSDSANLLDVFDFCTIMKVAYRCGLTSSNIQSFFRNTWLWPLDPSVVLRKSHLLSGDCRTVATVEDLERMLKEKQVMSRFSAGLKPIRIKRYS